MNAENEQQIKKKEQIIPPQTQNVHEQAGADVNIGAEMQNVVDFIVSETGAAENLNQQKCDQTICDLEKNPNQNTVEAVQAVNEVRENFDQGIANEIKIAEKKLRQNPNGKIAEKLKKTILLNKIKVGEEKGDNVDVLKTEYNDGYNPQNEPIQQQYSYTARQNYQQTNPVNNAGNFQTVNHYSDRRYDNFARKINKQAFKSRIKTEEELGEGDIEDVMKQMEKAMENMDMREHTRLQKSLQKKVVDKAYRKINKSFKKDIEFKVSDRKKDTHGISEIKQPEKNEKVYKCGEKIIIPQEDGKTTEAEIVKVFDNKKEVVYTFDYIAENGRKVRQAYPEKIIDEYNNWQDVIRYKDPDDFIENMERNNVDMTINGEKITRDNIEDFKLEVSDDPRKWRSQLRMFTISRLNEERSGKKESADIMKCIKDLKKKLSSESEAVVARAEKEFEYMVAGEEKKIEKRNSLESSEEALKLIQEISSSKDAENSKKDFLQHFKALQKMIEKSNPDLNALKLSDVPNLMDVAFAANVFINAPEVSFVAQTYFESSQKKESLEIKHEQVIVNQLLDSKVKAFFNKQGMPASFEGYIKEVYSDVADIKIEVKPISDMELKAYISNLVKASDGIEMSYEPGSYLSFSDEERVEHVLKEYSDASLVKVINDYSVPHITVKDKRSDRFVSAPIIVTDILKGSNGERRGGLGEDEGKSLIFLKNNFQEINLAGTFSTLSHEIDHVVKGVVNPDVALKKLHKLNIKDINDTFDGFDLEKQTESEIDNLQGEMKEREKERKKSFADDIEFEKFMAELGGEVSGQRFDETYGGGLKNQKNETGYNAFAVNEMYGKLIRYKNFGETGGIHSIGNCLGRIIKQKYGDKEVLRLVHKLSVEDQKKLLKEAFHLAREGAQPVVKKVDTFFDDFYKKQLKESLKELKQENEKSEIEVLDFSMADIEEVSKTVEGFKTLDENKKHFSLNLLNQSLQAKIELEVLKEYKERTGDDSQIVKMYDEDRPEEYLEIRKEEIEAFKNRDQKYLAFIKKSLEQSVRLFKTNKFSPEVKNHKGKLSIDFIRHDILDKEHKKIVNRFNIYANSFSNFSEEWSHGESEWMRDAYKEAKENYEENKEKMLDIVVESLGKEKGMQLMMEIDNLVRARQFVATNKQKGITSSGINRENIFYFHNEEEGNEDEEAGKELASLMSSGLSLNMNMAVLGGYIKGLETAIDIKYSEMITEIEGEDKDKKSSSSQVKLLERVKQKIEDTEDERLKSRLATFLSDKVSELKDKIEKEQINYGTYDERFKNQLDFIEALNVSTNISQIEIDQDYKEVLLRKSIKSDKRYKKAQSEKEREQEELIEKEMLKGAVLAYNVSTSKDAVKEILDKEFEGRNVKILELEVVKNNPQIFKEEEVEFWSKNADVLDLGSGETAQEFFMVMHDNKVEVEQYFYNLKIFRKIKEGNFNSKREKAVKNLFFGEISKEKRYEFVKDFFNSGLMKKLLSGGRKIEEVVTQIERKGAGEIKMSLKYEALELEFYIKPNSKISINPKAGVDKKDEHKIKMFEIDLNNRNLNMISRNISSLI